MKEKKAYGSIQRSIVLNTHSTNYIYIYIIYLKDGLKITIYKCNNYCDKDLL